MYNEEIKSKILEYIYCDDNLKKIAILNKEALKEILNVDEVKFEE